MWSSYEGLFPELEHVTSSKDRRRILSQAQTRYVLIRPWFWVLCASVVVFMIYGRGFLSVYFGLHGYISAGIVGAAAGISMTYGGFWFARRQIRLYLRHEMRGRGIPLCLRCGYDLRGTPSGRCPECGTRDE
jgi:hypothetical protein